MVDKHLLCASALTHEATSSRRLRAAVGAGLTALLALSSLILGGCAVTTSTQSPSNDVGTLIRSLWDFNDKAASEKRFRDALTRANKQDALELETQIARTFSLRRDFVTAHTMLDSIEERMGTSPRPALRVRYLLERGRSFNSAKQFETARPLFQEAYDLAIKHPALIGLAIDAAHMFGFSKDKEEAFRWTALGMKLALESEHPDAVGWRAGLANNLGSTERERGNLDAARAHFQIALKEHLERSKPQQIRIAHWQVANVHRLQGNIDEALAIQLRIEKEADEARAPDVYIYTELAELFDAKRDSAKAKSYATKALALAEKDSWMMENEAKLVERMRALLNN
jgi:tetratricopeptide (TPR) repeat protein